MHARYVDAGGTAVSGVQRVAGGDGGLSDTEWFLPSRTESDAFSSFRFVYEDFVLAIQNLA